MSFLAPLLLLAAVTLAVPLLLHLFRKRANRVRTFPALRYLRQTTREQARIVRLRQLLLLAMRLAVVALLVLAGARLVLPLGGGDQPPAGVAIVVDNGIGSATVLDDRRVLDHLVERARAGVERLGSDDRIWVIPAGEPWRAALPLDREGARRALAGLEPSGARADLPAAVARARSLLEAGAPPLREILLLSDLDAAAFAPSDGEGGAPADDVRVVVASLDAELPPNRGFTEVMVGGGLAPRADAAAELSARIEGEPAADQAVRLWVDERLVSAGRTDGEGRVLLPVPPLPEGWHAARLEMDPDALRLDDVHYLALPVRPPPRVQVASDLPRYLETALDVLADLERIELVEGMQAGPALGLEAEGRALGGRRPTLLFPPADPSRLPAVNQRLGELGAGWRLEASVGEASLTVTEAAPETRIPDGMEVRRRYRLVEENQAGAPGGRTLVRLSDGTPWVVHVRASPTPGAGEDGNEFPGLLLVGSAPDPEASGLPVSAAMVPFLSAALELLEGGRPVRPLPAGAPLPLPAEARQVRTPAGTLEWVEGTSSFLETGRPGVYDVLGSEGELLVRVAANPAPPVAGADRLSADEAAALLGPRAVAATGRRGWTSEIMRERRGREVWWPLLLGALLLLVAEGWIAAGGGGRPRSDERG